MFIITDNTKTTPYVYESNDIKDVGDIIIGITGMQEEGRQAQRICSNMAFGDRFATSRGYEIECKQKIEPNKIKYRIEMEINGSMMVEVEANSVEEAERKAMEIYYQTNFGPLENTQCNIWGTEDEYGNGYY